jgi:TolB protein
VTSRRNLLVGTIGLATWHISPVLAVDAEISGGSRRRSVAIADFIANSQSEIAVARGMVANVEADLIDSNLFNVVSSKTSAHVDALPDFDLWRRRRIDALIVGRVSMSIQNRIKIEFRLWNVMPGKQITAGMHFVELDNWPPTAHLISEAITSALR